MPNGTIISNKVTNWTLSDRYRAIEVPVTVARGAAPRHVIEVSKRVAANHPGFTKEPAPQAHVVNFASATVSFNQPFACLERSAKTSHGSLGGGKCCDSSAWSEDVRCRGRSGSEQRYRWNNQRKLMSDNVMRVPSRSLKEQFSKGSEAWEEQSDPIFRFWTERDCWGFPFFSLSASRYFGDKETLCLYWPLGTVVITGPKVLDLTYPIVRLR